MDSTKKLISFMKRSGSDEVQVLYLINNPTEEQLAQHPGPPFMHFARPIIVQATCSDEKLTTAAVARGQTTWNEIDIKNDLELDEV